MNRKVGEKSHLLDENVQYKGKCGDMSEQLLTPSQAPVLASKSFIIMFSGASRNSRLKNYEMCPCKRA
jgi:hypothetical protein